MDLLKGKCNSKGKAGKGILKIIVRQMKCTFFGKEVFRKCGKIHAKKGM